jgi:hypothetical protein
MIAKLPGWMARVCLFLLIPAIASSDHFTLAKPHHQVTAS